MVDLNKRTNNRRKKMQKIWRSAAWKKVRDEFLQDHPLCEFHLKLGVEVPAVTVHHPYENSYSEIYLDLAKSQGIALCNKCHFNLHKGRKLCPVCKKRYTNWNNDQCSTCYAEAHPEIIEEIKRKKKEQKEKLKELNRARRAKVKKPFPCKHRLKSGKCRLSKNQCPYSERTCKTKCGEFEVRS